MSKIKQLIEKYENGEDCGLEIIEEYYKLTSHINKRESMGDSMYPNLLKFIKKVVQ